MLIISLIMAISLTAITIIFSYRILVKFFKLKNKLHLIFIPIIIGLISFSVYYILTIQFAIRMFVLL